MMKEMRHYIIPSKTGIIHVFHTKVLGGLELTIVMKRMLIYLKIIWGLFVSSLLTIKQPSATKMVS